MMIIPGLLFWISAIAIAHTYLIYPLLMYFLSYRKSTNTLIYKNIDDMPELSVIMAVHNAEKVIVKKIKSVFESGYSGKIKFYIGSDASDDDTDKLILEMKELYPDIQFKRFEQRIGKVRIINELESMTSSEILVFTDAHAFFEEASLENLVKHFLNPDIKVVGGLLKNLKLNIDGIAYQENSYLKQEFMLKYAEGKMWGTMMGANGAFYAVRKSAFCPVPDNFIVDDFYISLKAIQNGGKSIIEPQAIAIENVSGSLQTEFKRKVRISIGNFQNLRVLYPLLFSKRLGLAFSFLSHKVLRWLGPLFLSTMMISSFLLLTENLFHTIFFIIIALSIITPLIDYFSRKIQFHVIILRFITHFYYMNLALLIGLFKFMKGVKTNVWEPTNRE